VTPPAVPAPAAAVPAPPYGGAPTLRDQILHKLAELSALVGKL
jgi:hypothetical protein